MRSPTIYPNTVMCFRPKSPLYLLIMVSLWALSKVGLFIIMSSSSMPGPLFDVHSCLWWLSCCLLTVVIKATDHILFWNSTAVSFFWYNMRYLIYQITKFVLRQNCPTNLKLSFIKFRKHSKRNNL